MTSAFISPELETGPVSSPNLLVSDENEYQRLVADLTDQARTIAAKNEDAARVLRITELTKSIAAFTVAANAELPKFPPVQQRFRQITAWMRAALARERSIFGDGQAAVARSQISVSIQQAGIQAEQLQSSIENAHREMGTELDSIVKTGTDLRPYCASTGTEKGDAQHIACAAFLKSEDNLRSVLTKLNEAFAETRKVWSTEHQAQQELMRAAELASR